MIKSGSVHNGLKISNELWLGLTAMHSRYEPAHQEGFDAAIAPSSG